VLRRRDVRTHGEPFVVPGGPLVPTLTCAIITGVIVATVSWLEVAAVAAVLALSTGVYVLRRP